MYCVGDIVRVISQNEGNTSGGYVGRTAKVQELGVSGNKDTCRIRFSPNDSTWVYAHCLELETDPGRIIYANGIMV